MEGWGLRAMDMRRELKGLTCRLIEFIKMQLSLLNSRWKIRFRQTFFQMKYKELFISRYVSVTYPLVDHSERIYSPSNLRFIQKTKKLKFVPITL